jgi:hypothetical protein
MGDWSLIESESSVNQTIEFACMCVPVLSSWVTQLGVCNHTDLQPSAQASKFGMRACYLTISLQFKRICLCTTFFIEHFVIVMLIELVLYGRLVKYFPLGVRSTRTCLQRHF